MKIFTNVQDIPVSNRNISRNTVQEQVSREKGMSRRDRGHAAMHTNQGNSRQTISALSMAQTAHTIVNKAINISMHIKREMMESFASSDMDISEIQARVSSMNNQLNSFGVPGVSVPVSQNSNDTVELPMKEISGTMQSMQSLVNSIGPNSGNLQDQVASLTGELQQHRQNIGFFIDTLSRSGNIPVPQSAVDSIDSAADLTARTASSITGDPVSAMLSQGNINSEQASELV